MTVAIRQAVPGDLEALAAILRESPTAPQWSAAELARMVLPGAPAALARTALVAYEGSLIAGFAVYTLLRSTFPPEAALESLAVAAAYRRLGVGTALLRAAESAVSVAGAEVLALEVRAGNTAALSVYREAGFKRVGTRRAYYAAPVEDAVLMQLTLPGGDRTGVEQQ